MSTFPVDTPYITVPQPKCWKLKNGAKVIITKLPSIRHECQPWVVFSRTVVAYITHYETSISVKCCRMPALNRRPVSYAGTQRAGVLQAAREETAECWHVVM